MLASIPREAPAYREEVFGPVALLFKVRDLDEALALANDSVFGLGASLWSTDPAEQERYLSTIALGRMGEPEQDIGRTVVFLCGPDSRYMTGQTINVDGGQGML